MGREEAEREVLARDKQAVHKLAGLSPINGTSSW